MHSILKVFSSQGRLLLAAFRQIDVSTFFFFLLFFCFFDLQKGLCCVLQPHFEACCKHTSQRAELLKTSSFAAQLARGGGCALCLCGCAGMYRSGWWCPVSSQPVCAHPARQKIRLTQAVQQTSQSYFWNSTRGQERDKVMKILSRWINVAALTFVTCSGDGLRNSLGVGVSGERGGWYIWLHCNFSSL